jgi:hypothetical protein
MSRQAIPRLAAAAAFAILALGGCATATTYHPAVSAAEGADGYHETRLEAGRWRVVFRGNSLTSREAVETALLYRAAELTRAEGYDWFLAVDRDTESHSDLLVRGAPGGWDRSWSPHWRVVRGGVWETWEPLQPDRTVAVAQVTAYEAIAEIVMGHGTKPEDSRAYDAASVIDALQSRIIRPGAGE